MTHRAECHQHRDIWYLRLCLLSLCYQPLVKCTKHITEAQEQTPAVHNNKVQVKKTLHIQFEQIVHKMTGRRMRTILVQML